MKIVSLNAWGGRVREPFLEFIATKGNDADVLCLQEVYHNAENKSNDGLVHVDMFQAIDGLLENHVGHFCPTVGDFYGIATFVHRKYDIVAVGDILIYENPEYEHGGNHSRKALWVEVESGGIKTSILNVHGLWNGKGKTDTPERIEQSKRIKTFSESVRGRQIVCGDFNLLPDTESLAIIKNGLRDLVQEYGVTSTRTSYYTRAATSGTFADYIFVGDGVEVRHFEVMTDEVSDHAALLTEIDG